METQYWWVQPLWRNNLAASSEIDYVPALQPNNPNCEYIQQRTPSHGHKNVCFLMIEIKKILSFLQWRKDK